MVRKPCQAAGQKDRTNWFERPPDVPCVHKNKANYFVAQRFSIRWRFYSACDYVFYLACAVCNACGWSKVSHKLYFDINEKDKRLFSYDI